MKKINLGSGPFSAKGWINYDWGLLPVLGKYRLTPIFVRLGFLDKSYDCRWTKIKLVDVRKGLPDEDNSVEYIYCSNVLEHFEKSETIKILEECCRVLRSGGKMRIVLPDLTRLIQNYNNAESFNNEFFGFNKAQYIGLIGKIKRFFLRGHLWMYDAKSFKVLLENVGFNEIKLRSFRKGKFPEIEILDLKVHQPLCFYYECKK